VEEPHPANTIITTTTDTAATTRMPTRSALVSDRRSELAIHQHYVEWRSRSRVSVLARGERATTQRSGLTVVAKTRQSLHAWHRGVAELRVGLLAWSRVNVDQKRRAGSGGRRELDQR
jgi:hypothetical protein